MIRVGDPEWPESRLLIWRAGFPLVRALAGLLAPWQLIGGDRLPAGGCILVANHINWKDPPWIEFAIGHAIRYMTKAELFEFPVLGLALRAIGCFPVRRGYADRRALTQALRVLAAGNLLGLFPEGHRSESGALIRAHPGIGLVALRSGAPIVPVAVRGTKGARVGRVWRHDIRITIGEPFRATDLAEAVSGDEQALTDAIMRRVALLLPSEMRGVYA